MQYNRANSCIVYLNGVYHVDLIGMNGAELPIVEWNGAERCVKVNRAELPMNANGTRTDPPMNAS